MSVAEAEIYAEIDQALLEGRPADAETLREKLAQVAATKPKQHIFEINGHKYTHIRNTHKFRRDNKDNEFELDMVLRLIYPTQYKSLKVKLDTPIMLTDMSPACRRKAMKMIELHYYPNLTLPYVEETLALIECAQAAVVSERSSFFQGFFAAQAATDYDSIKALTLYVYFGNTILEANRTDRVALYKMIADQRGIHLRIGYPHTMEDRINHALSVMAVMANYNLSMGFPVKVKSLVSKGFQVVSSYNGLNISYTKDFFMEVSNTLSTYARRIARGDFTMDSDLRFPYQLIEPEYRFLPWEKVHAMDTYLCSKRGQKLFNDFQNRFRNYERDIPIEMSHINNFFKPEAIKNAAEHGLIRLLPNNKFMILWPNLVKPKIKFEKIVRRKVDRKKIEENKIQY